MPAAINPAYGRKDVFDTFTGKSYPSQTAMVKEEFPGNGKFYMYQAYELYPGRFIVNGKPAMGRNVIHWDISTPEQTMVNCGMDLTDKKSKILSEVTCKKCLKGVNMDAPVFDEIAAVLATAAQWSDIAIYDLGLNGKAVAPSYLEAIKFFHLDRVNFHCFLCEFSNENPGSGDAHNCDHCPLNEELIDDLHKQQSKIQLDGICESRGAPWHEFKGHVNDEDPSDRYDIAMKAVAMCNHRLKTLLKERLNPETGCPGAGYSS